MKRCPDFCELSMDQEEHQDMPNTPCLPTYPKLHVAVVESSSSSPACLEHELCTLALVRWLFLNSYLFLMSCLLLQDTFVSV